MLGRFSRGALVLAVMGVLVAPAAAQERSGAHIVPFFPTASDARPMGLVRVVNLSDESGTVDIVATDAAGQRFDDVSLAIGAHETVHFDADDLEMGNADVGLTGGTGAGQGDWRLELTGELDIEVQAYVRTPAGAFAEMYETGAGDGERFRIPTFNPGENAHQVGLLWLFNPGDESVTATVQGTDDLGQSPGPGVSIELPAGEARTYTAAELESGAARGLTGSLGDGVGKWRLAGEASSPVRAMSLISSPTGHLTNLSTVPAHASGGIHRVPLFPPASEPLGRQGFARVVNRSDRAGAVRMEAFDGTDWTYDALTLAIGANETLHFNSDDLELGNPVKGLTGSTGAGEGDWRLELTSDLDIEVLSYVRMLGSQGYVTPMHDTSAQETDGLMRYYVPIFHGAYYEGQESRLHLLNLGESEVRVGIAGLDDAGAAPPAGDVSLVLGPGETRVVTSEQLEDGGQGLDGRFGSGAGRWRLFVSSQEALQVMSLGYSADGFLANLSRGSPPASDVPVVVPVVAPDLVVEIPSVSDGAPEAGQAFTLSARVRNRGDGDAGATTLRYYRSANANISASDLEVGNDRVNALSASQSSGASLTLNAPEDPGTYYYGACADVVPDESDTTNNCSAGLPVTVSEPGASNAPDLVVSVSVDNDTPDAGGEFELTATVRNVGDGASSSTTLRYYRSPDATITTADTEQGIDAMHALSASQSSGASLTLNAPEDPGTYYYGACADAVPDESDTTNNCSAGLPVTVSEPGASNAPDLVVSVSVDTDTPDAGGEFELTASVRNVGDGASASTTLRYYRSPDATITTADTEQGTGAMHALSASQSSRASLTLNAPEDPGTYYYGACVDAVPDESDTTNNCSRGRPATVSGGPDLVVGAPAVSDSRPDAGATFALSATVTNQGDGDAEATTLRFYRSDNAAVSATDVEIGSNAVDALPAGESSDTSLVVMAPSESGTYHYGACVDALAEESDMANNCSPSVLVTVPAPPGQPDLVVVSPSVSDSQPGVGEGFKLSATVRNDGDDDSEATTLRYYRSEDATISAADTLAGEDSVEALGPSGSSGESIDLTAPEDAGIYFYGACVDAVTNESDTSDNCSPAVSVTVPDVVSDIPDLIVESPSVTEAMPAPGAEFDLSAVVRNIGNGDAMVTTLRYYRSTDPRIRTSDTQEGTDPVDALSAAGTSAETILLTAPSTAGTYYYGACVEPVDGESNTTNNCSSAVEIVVPAPNLRLIESSTSQRHYLPGAEATFTATVVNTGTQATPASTLHWSIGVNSDRLQQFATAVVPALNPSDASTASAQHVLGTEARTRTLRYKACVDIVEGESNTTDNCLFRSFKVLYDPLDDLNVSIPEDCPLEVDICVRDHKCVDGDIVRVSVNGAVLYTKEITSRWACESATVMIGENTIEAYAVNHFGDKGCAPNFANTGALIVRASAVASTSWSYPAGGTSSATLTVTQGEAGTCPVPR